MSTEAARTFNDCDLCKVSRRLSYSEETSRKYYEFGNTKDATDTHWKIKLLSKQITNRQHRNITSGSSVSSDSEKIEKM